VASIPEIETLQAKPKKGKSQKTFCQSIVSHAVHFIKMVLEFGKKAFSLQRHND